MDSLKRIPLVAAALLLAGCLGPTPTVLPEAQSEDAPAPPGPASESSSPAAEAPVNATGPTVPAPQRREDTWSGTILLAAPTGLSVTSDPHALRLALPTTLTLLIEDDTAPLGVGPLHVAVRASPEAEPVLEMEGPTPLRLRGEVGQGTWNVWVTGGQGGAAVDRGYRASAEWWE